MVDVQDPLIVPETEKHGTLRSFMQKPTLYWGNEVVESLKAREFFGQRGRMCPSSPQPWHVTGEEDFFSVKEGGPVDAAGCRENCRLEEVKEDFG